MKRLEHEVTQKEDSIENLFCKVLEKENKIEAMQAHQSEMMIALITTKEDSDIESMYKELNKMIFFLPVTKARMENLGYTIDRKTEMMIAIVSETVGTAVMYAYYLSYKAKMLGLKKITFKDLCEKIFPFGFFSRKAMDNIWDAQKVNRGDNQMGSDNLLDYAEASRSLELI